MAPTEVQLRKLEALTARLNDQSDQFNREIDRLEQRLSRPGVGVTLWLESRAVEVTLRSFAPKGTSADRDVHASPAEYDGWCNGYTRLGGSWRLTARKGSFARIGPATDGTWPNTGCFRHMTPYRSTRRLAPSEQRRLRSLAA